MPGKNGSNSPVLICAAIGDLLRLKCSVHSSKTMLDSPFLVGCHGFSSARVADVEAGILQLGKREVTLPEWTVFMLSCSVVMGPSGMRDFGAILAQDHCVLGFTLLCGLCLAHPPCP